MNGQSLNCIAVTSTYMLQAHTCYMFYKLEHTIEPLYMSTLASGCDCTTAGIVVGGTDTTEYGLEH